MLPSRKQFLFFLVVILLVAGGSFVTGVGYDHFFLQRPAAPSQTISVPAGSSQNFQLMINAWNLIQKNYVDRAAVKADTMTYGAISGMVDALGDTGHSRFMSPEMVRSEQSLTTGSFEGIGAEVQMKGDQVVIVAPFEGSPAQKAGIKSGDIILKVDGKDTTGQTLQEVVSHILGPAGTTVKLTVADPKTRATRDLTITRAKIKLTNIDWAMIPGTTIADIHINEFSKGVTQQLQDTIKAAQAKGATEMVLDLRDNPGGLLDEAVGVTSQFIKSGDALQIKDAKGNIKHFPVQGDGVALNIPMIVLINQGTASASEIVSGALQDTGRARLVGETTFGTGTVLNEFPLPDKSALLLATGEWLTPKGRVIWHHGITPDDTVSLADNVQPVYPQLGQHLTTGGDPAQATQDAQLMHALQVLDASQAQSVK